MTLGSCTHSLHAGHTSSHIPNSQLNDSCGGLGQVIIQPPKARKSTSIHTNTPSPGPGESAHNTLLKLAGYQNWLASCQSCPVSCHRLHGGVSRLTQELSTWRVAAARPGCTNTDHGGNTDWLPEQKKKGEKNRSPPSRLSTASGEPCVRACSLGAIPTTSVQLTSPLKSSISWALVQLPCPCSSLTQGESCCDGGSL